MMQKVSEILLLRERDLAEGAMDRVVGDLQQLRANAQSQVNRMLGNITGKRTRIGVLTYRKNCLTIIISAKCPPPTAMNGRVCTQKILRRRADEDIDEFIKDYRLYLNGGQYHYCLMAGGKQRA
ncbi:unnamed protein product [Rhizophagus irregularis]|nr:unnamed protein product [Rhizophagus irregularis]